MTDVVRNSERMEQEIAKAVAAGWKPTYLSPEQIIIEKRRPLPHWAWLLLSVGSWLVLFIRRQTQGDLRMQVWFNEQNEPQYNLLNPESSNETIGYALLGLGLTLLLLLL